MRPVSRDGDNNDLIHVVYTLFILHTDVCASAYLLYKSVQQHMSKQFFTWFGAEPGRTSTVNSSSAEFKVNTINPLSNRIQIGSQKAGQKWIHALKIKTAGVLSQRQRSGVTERGDKLKTGRDTVLSGNTQAWIRQQTEQTCESISTGSVEMDSVWF